ncbi:hypothetical protein OHS33_06225 [Streptomyces sp. NBC_00536]|uniref:hypothetical protein n=1 Tax=Streptomyces sp. NBC_00536 TaxID=2975769 RepID=UPI002E81E3AF|nr:hypothetical protein [Streptomyces sp. NBC_00536]WUC77970.1 hypothetical protein OHS33_06225 [Streptomyces sp. NBC_00536]
MIPVQAAPLWAYGIGATFAVAAGRQLQWWERSVRGEGVRTRSRAAQPYLALTVLYAALLLAPSGAYLLWQNPAWATMQVAHDHRGVWAGFALFQTGSVVVGALLGFLAARLFVLVGAGYWGYLQAVAGYFLMFFTLIHGWDGTGYRRVLSTGAGSYADWSAGGTDGAGGAGGRAFVNHCLRFATSGTFLALVVLGAAVLGVMLLIQIGWLVEGWRLPGAAADLRVSRPLAVMIAGAGVYGLPLAGALGASVLVRLLGWAPGGVLFAGLAGVVLLPRWSPVRGLYGLVGVPHRHWRVEPEPDGDQPSGGTVRASRSG